MVSGGRERAGGAATPSEVSLSRWFSILNGFEQLDTEWETSAMVFRWLGLHIWNWEEEAAHDDAEGDAREAAVQALLSEDAMADPGIAAEGGPGSGGGVAPPGGVAPESDGEEEQLGKRRLTGKQALARLRAQSSNTMELAGKLLQDRWRLLVEGMVVRGMSQQRRERGLM